MLQTLQVLSVRLAFQICCLDVFLDCWSLRLNFGGSVFQTEERVWIPRLPEPR